MTEITDFRKMYFEDGEDITQIQKKTGFDRKIIRKFIKNENWNEPIPVSREKESKLDRFKQEIDQWLTLERDKRAAWLFEI